MNVLVVGSGGREHAIVKKLKKSNSVTNLYCAPGNGGISKDCECVNIRATDILMLTQFALSKQIDFCVATPDDPLVLGIVDEMEKAGIKCFGPSKLAAAIEGSKVFSKGLMKKYNIPTADYKVFTNPKEALTYIKERGRFPTVIKADGLALGKGVIIATNVFEATEGIHSIMEEKIFGESGSQIVIEEFLQGPEVSVLAFCDSKTIVPMVTAMDHKRAHDNDEGLNTGGMGTIAPNPFYTKEIADICMKTIFLPTISAMNEENRPFKGCLFFGLMLTKDGPKVIEYNCRFGDPETQVVLPLLKTDLMSIFEACANETLADIKIEFSDEACACVVMASGGYPQKYETSKVIKGLDKKSGEISEPKENATEIFHAGTKCDNGEFLTSGGRVLGVSCKGDTLEKAIENAYKATKKITFDGAFMRNDIGAKAISHSGI